MKFLIIAALAVSATAFAQSDDEVDVSAGGLNMNIKIKDGQRGGRAQAQVQATSHQEMSSDRPGESFKLAWDSEEYGKTSFRVLEPEGFSVRITDPNNFPRSETIPFS